MVKCAHNLAFRTQIREMQGIRGKKCKYTQKNALTSTAHHVNPVQFSPLRLWAMSSLFSKGEHRGLSEEEDSSGQRDIQCYSVHRGWDSKIM